MTLDNDFENHMRRVLDSGHESRPEAHAPPADTWQQVLAKVQPNPSEEENMNTGILVSPITGPPTRLMQPADQKNRGAGHYLNMAVTVALVAAVAVAGWLTAMQLNQPGDPEPRLAMMSATPDAEATPASESATCNVDPLSTDRVMEIVKNPARFMARGATGEPSERPMTGSPTNAELWEVDPDLEIVGESGTPTEEQFDEASVIANEYLNCLIHGTQGQIWTFYSPVLLQQKVLGEFPVFAEESQVRERVDELSTQPAYEAEYVWEEALSVNTDSMTALPEDPPELEFDSNIASVSVNPDYQLARMHQSESSYYEYVLSIGISIEDEDGTQIVLTNGTGNSIVPADPFGSGMNPPMIYIQIAKLRSSDGWVIIPWPSEAEMGWNLYD